jgi:hypothetical protein
MDNIKLGIGREIVEIYQDFENDRYNALTEGLPKIKNYTKLILRESLKTKPKF